MPRVEKCRIEERWPIRTHRRHADPDRNLEPLELTFIAEIPVYTRKTEDSLLTKNLVLGHPNSSPDEQFKFFFGNIFSRFDPKGSNKVFRGTLADSFLMRVAAIEAAQALLLEEAGVEEEEVEPELDSSGDISVLTGSGTYTDYDRIYVGLRQVYKDRQERYFT